MLVKCETKSFRVKGLSFHPKLSWILTSLHTGVIQLWDYRIGSLIDKFEEHEGPVRGVDFHSSQALFVSGGDDYRVKVWSYRQRRCLFTLLGHLDYIRTVQFHQEYPWILSASDDQTVRIWNWQSRNCIAVLTGHNHYVMCAQFHPKADLIASASLDQSIRVWDTAGLREKTVSMGGGGGGGAGMMLPPGVGGGSGGGLSSQLLQHPHHHSDLFGTNDAICKFVLEGHDRGVNWVCFHQTLPLLASAADDRLIKLWRYNDSKAWEVDTLRGHFNNVSCVVFHPHHDILLSNSEDRTIRVWDVSKRVGVHTFRREGDRFWVLATHQFSNLIAVGHDSGMVVFKLNRERPPFSFHNNTIFYVRDRTILAHDIARDSSTNIAGCRRPANALSPDPKMLAFNHFNTTEMNLLVFYQENENRAYDLITASFTQPGSSTIVAGTLNTFSGNCVGVAFVARNRFACLEWPANLAIMNLENEVSKVIELPCATDRIYPTNSQNKILLKSEDKAILFDVTTRKSLGEVNCSGGIRYVVANSFSGQEIAFLSKHSVLLTTSSLQYLYSFHENIRVKGGAWDENGVFVYSTLSHVKYCLKNGDQGIIFSLQEPIYIFRVYKQHLYYLDRRQKVVIQPLNCEEYLFKVALQKRQFDQVALFIRNGRLCGNAVIGYLKKKGYPEVAMQFVEADETRLNLALEYGHIDEALKSAQKLDDKTVWRRLGSEAMRQGNHQVVEMVYQKLKDLEKLSFLYFITGNSIKLRKMLKIAEVRNDVMSRFQNALLLGDVEERVKILASVGQLPLAALAARTHALKEFSEALEPAVDSSVELDVEKILGRRPQLLLPPIPINRVVDNELINWPFLSPYQNIFDTAMKATEGMSPEMADAHLQQGLSAGVAGDGSSAGDMGGVGDDAVDEGWGTLDDALGDGGGWGEDGIDVAGEAADVNGDTPRRPPGGKGGAICPDVHDVISKGEKPENLWLKGQSMVADLAASGEFTKALQLLNRTIGLINYDVIKPYLIEQYEATWVAMPCLPQTPPLTFPILDSGNLLLALQKCQGGGSESQKISPNRLYGVGRLIELLRASHRLVTGGKFEEALASFRKVLNVLPLCVASNAEDELQLREFTDICLQYVTGMRLEVMRLQLEDSNPKRTLELLSYFTCCKMQPAHLFLVLRRAMSISWRMQNYSLTSSFARRLIQGNFASIKGSQEEVQKTKKVLVLCEQKGTDAIQIDFNPTADIDNLLLDTSTLTRMEQHESSVRCPYCGSSARVDKKGTLCPNCEMSELGAQVMGIQFRSVI